MDMETIPQTAEQEELVIDTVEGLVDFLVYAQDAYDDFKESAASCPSQDDCLPYLTQAREAYERVQSLVERHCKVLDLGGFLSQDDVEEIQDLYNKILSAKDDLEREFSKLQSDDIDNEESQIDADEPGDGTDDFSHHLSSESPYEEYGMEDRAVVLQANGALNIVDETQEPHFEVLIKHTPIDTETFRRNLKEVKSKTKTLVQQGESMLEEYQSVSKAANDNVDFENRTSPYERLKIVVAQMRYIADQIEIRNTVVPTEDSEVFILNVNNELDGSSKNLETLGKELELFFKESKLRSTSDESDTKEVYPSTVMRAANDNYSESYRPTLFTKNEMRPAIEKVVSIPEYKRFLSEYFSSPGAFEAYLRREINTREKISKFDSVFGIIRKSPFDTLLRDMKLTEVEAFEAQPTEKIKQHLQQKDIQYEMYVDWMHAYQVMKQLVRTSPTMTFGELYVAAMVKELMDKETSLAA